MKNAVLLGILALLLATLGPGDVQACGDGGDDPDAWCEPTCEATLWAGRNEAVGTVTVRRARGLVLVTYEVLPPWSLCEVHLHVARSVWGIPHSRGGPVPGRFRYKATVGGTSHTFRIPACRLPSRRLVVAAHAVVAKGGCGTECAEASLVLPEGPVQVCVTSGAPTAYLRHTISGAGALDGVYDAWCVDLEGGIETGACYEMGMVSSLAPAAELLIDLPGNWDLVNYLLNRDWAALLGAHPLEIQFALWALVDTGTPSGEQGPVDQGIVDQILADVTANGEGFVPGPGDLLAVVLSRGFGIQNTIIGVRIPECTPGERETAWAGECEYPGRNWARYFVCVPERERCCCRCD